MPRTPIDYSKAIIYKIQHLEKDELVYVGSTTSFVKRKYAHKSACKTKPNKVYEMIRDNGGWDCFNMIIIKDYPCHSSKELNQEEDRVMRELNSSLNMVRAYRSAEYKLKYTKEYAEKNKEELKKYRVEYYQINKEQIKEARKEYVEKNRENVLKQKRISNKKNYDTHKVWREKNKEEINKKRRERYLEKKINAINLKK